jgi:hypothetical protein
VTHMLSAGTINVVQSSQLNCTTLQGCIKQGRSLLIA